MANQENSADDVKAKMAAALEAKKNKGGRQVHQVEQVVDQRSAVVNEVVVHLRCNAKQDHLVLALLVNSIQ